MRNFHRTHRLQQFSLLHYCRTATFHFSLKPKTAQIPHTLRRPVDLLDSATSFFQLIFSLLPLNQSLRDDRASPINEED